MNEIVKDDQYYVDMYYTYGAIEWLRTSPPLEKPRVLDNFNPDADHFTNDVWILLIKMQRYLQGVKLKTNHTFTYLPDPSGIIDHDKDRINALDKLFTPRASNGLRLFFKPFQRVFIKAGYYSKEEDGHEKIFTQTMVKQLTDALSDDLLLDYNPIDILACYRYIDILEINTAVANKEIEHIRNRVKRSQENKNKATLESRKNNIDSYIEDISQSHEAFIDSLKNKREFINKLVELDYEFCKKNNYKVYRKSLLHLKESVQNYKNSTYNLARLTVYRTSIKNHLEATIYDIIYIYYLDYLEDYLAIDWIEKIYSKLEDE